MLGFYPTSSAPTGALASPAVRSLVRTDLLGIYAIAPVYRLSSIASRTVHFDGKRTVRFAGGKHIVRF